MEYMALANNICLIYSLEIRGKEGEAMTKNTHYS